MAKWRGSLVAHLARFKEYPYSARFLHEQGVVMMRVTMGLDGHVRHAEIAKSSGFEDLDVAAKAWIQRADPLPVIPPEMTVQQIELVIPLRFILQ